LVLEIGNRAERDVVHYAEADLVLVRSEENGSSFFHRDGSLY
jgi:uncharacterized cupin superfamily protein